MSLSASEGRVADGRRINPGGKEKAGTKGPEVLYGNRME